MIDGSPPADVVEAYARPRLDASSRWDEMVDPARGVRDSWRSVGSVLSLLGPAGLTEQRRNVAAMLAQDGVTYRPHGADHEQPWELDPVPMLLDEAAWSRLEPALVQRTELLDLILTDLYGPRRLLAEGLIPPDIVFGHAGFFRVVDQIRLPGARQLFLSAADLARGPDGQWTVLADRTQAPSGTGYAMANRRVVSRALPGLYRDTRLHRIGPFFQAMRVALQALAPGGSEVPRIVLLTSGPGSETAFDQAFLSSLLGFPLVEGTDLLVRDGQVWQRSIGRLEPVDVILRRVDAWFCDPLELNPRSQLGVPGLVEASRLGTVSVANGLGTGVLENPALFPYLPRLCEVLLGESLAVPSVQTWWCGDELSRRHVLARLDSLVIKPVSRRIVQTSRFGWELSRGERDDLTRQIEADPTAWVGQEAIHPSTAPGVGDHGLEARPLGTRFFAVAERGSYRILPGGLSRVAPGPSSLVVTTENGSLAKDVWVLSGSTVVGGEGDPDDHVRGQVVSAVSPRIAETLFWLGRYAERAEDVSRLVAVADNRLRDLHPGADPALGVCAEVMLQALLEVTSTGPGGPIVESDPYQQVRHVIGVGVGVGVGGGVSGIAGGIGEAQRPGTLAHDVRRVLELAYASRDQLSIDTWSVFRDLDRTLAPFGNGLGAGTGGGHGDIAATMTALRRALMAFAGLAAESMVRDSGWHFLDAGRRLERALQIGRLLQGALVTRHSPAVDALVEESTVTAAESIITHRRRYPPQSGADTVLELLVLDHENPRSVAFQLDRLGVDLRRVSLGKGDDTLDARVVHISSHLLAVDCATLAQADAGGHRGALADFLDSVVRDLHELGVAIEQAHFAHLGTLQQLAPLGDVESLETV